MTSIKKYMKVGIVHFMAFPSTIRGEGPIVETIKKVAADDYFDVIEVTWMKDDEVRKKAAKLLETSKIKVCYGAQPRLLTTGLNPNHLDDAERIKALDTLKEAVDEAKKLGSKGVAFLSGKYEEKTKEKSYQQLVKTTKELCKYAKEKDMDVVLEIFDYDIAKQSLIGPTSLAKRFAKDITKEYGNFGLMVDLSHIPMYYESIQEALQPIKDYLVHVHIGNTVICDKDVEGYGDEHIRFGFPNSENDVEELVEFLKELKNIGYLDANNPKVVSFEVKPWRDEDPEMVIANAKRTLNEAWAKLDM
ncbi:MAG: sugar phosphate isomerase/epimerase [Clostridia bacterium]|nr:sugar phosphate isomerase/epimerase [Clostridia bacterium]